MEKLAKFLQLYGGWGMTAVLMVGIVLLYRSMSKVIEQRNQLIVDLLRETTSVLTQARDTNREVADTNRDTSDLLKRVEKVVTVAEVRREDGGAS
jgi:hypothetical protein